MAKLDRRRLLIGTSLLAAAPPLLRTAHAASTSDSARQRDGQQQGGAGQELGGRHGLSQLALELPANSAAEVRLPGRPHDWLEGGRPLGHAAQRLIGSEDSHFVVELGSGRYDLRRST